MRLFLAQIAALAVATTTAVWAVTNMEAADAAMTEKTNGEMTASAKVGSLNADPTNVEKAFNVTEPGAENPIVDAGSETDIELPTKEFNDMLQDDANGNWIGEVDTLATSNIRAFEGAVLRDYGFSDMSKNDVLVSFDSLKFKQAEDGDETRVYVDVTKEELEEMPNFTS